MGRSGCRSARGCCSAPSACCSASGSRGSSGSSMPDAPAGETLGVGLASGLLVLAAWWAAIASGGRSSFTPVAVGFAIAIGLAAVRRWRPRIDRSPTTGRRRRMRADRPPTPATPPTVAAATWSWPSSAARSSSSRVALLYGSTLIQSPRDGVQPTRGHGRRLLLGPRARPRPDRDRDDLLAVGLRRRSRACPTRPGTTGARPGWRPPRSRSSAPRRWTPGISSSCRCSSSRPPR